MDPRSAASATDLAGQAGALSTGLGILTIQVFPIAMPLLVLALGPVVLLAVVIGLLALPILIPVRLGRLALRALRGPPPQPVRSLSS
jgi:hypothetical protein